MAYDFDGIDDFVRDDVTDFDNDIVFETVWFKTSTTATDRINEISNGTASFIINLNMQSDGQIRVTQRWSGNNGVWDTDSTFNDGVWHQLAFHLDRSSVNNDPVIFIDGVIVAITENIQPSGSADTTYTRITYGANRNDGTDYLGQLGESAISTGSITPANLGEALGRGVNPFPIIHQFGTLITSYPLNGNQSPEQDYSGNANLPTVTGATKFAGNPPVQLLSRYL